MGKIHLLLMIIVTGSARTGQMYTSTITADIRYLSPNYTLFYFILKFMTHAVKTAKKRWRDDTLSMVITGGVTIHSLWLSRGIKPLMLIFIKY